MIMSELPSISFIAAYSCGVFVLLLELFWLEVRTTASMFSKYRPRFRNYFFKYMLCRLVISLGVLLTVMGVFAAALYLGERLGGLLLICAGLALLPLIGRLRRARLSATQAPGPG